jgi:hypothetical protein
MHCYRNAKKHFGGNNKLVCEFPLNNLRASFHVCVVDKLHHCQG